MAGTAAGDARHGARAAVRAAAKQIRQLAKIAGGGSGFEAAGMLVALAYPDRIGQRRGEGRFRLSGGGGAAIDLADPLAAEEFIAVADLDGAARDARVYLAAPLTLSEIESLFAEDIAEIEIVAWDERREEVRAVRQRCLGSLILEERRLRDPDQERIMSALLDGVRQLGLDVLPWTPRSAALRNRVALLRRNFPEEGWPDLSDAVLLASLDLWLGPAITGMRRRADLAAVDLAQALAALLPWPLPKRLDVLAPTHLTVPSGSRLPVEYGAGNPALHVKLQEMFGQTGAPAIGEGRIPVVLHLLSPAGRPVAVTSDLESFWANVYPQVSGEMRSRYPRHTWPEDPLAAAPTRRTLKRRGS